MRLAILATFRVVDDAEFDAIRHLPLREGVIVDVGANAGQSAVALGRLIPNRPIFSFEPQLVFDRELRFAQWILGPRHKVNFFALGAESKENQVLAVPITNGVERLARASTIRQQGSDSRASKDTERLITVPLRTLDEQRLAPALIKVDVEGAEAAVLEGGERTIKNYRPVIVAEVGLSFVKCQELLRAWNYRLFSWDKRRKCFVDVGGTVNFFAVPIEIVQKICHAEH